MMMILPQIAYIGNGMLGNRSTLFAALTVYALITFVTYESAIASLLKR